MLWIRLDKLDNGAGSGFLIGKTRSRSISVESFRFLSAIDVSNPRWLEWSRVYEYELALEALAQFGASKDSLIHNTCWGFQGCHVLFRDELSGLYPKTIHSDLKASSDPNTIVYDVTQRPSPQLTGSFDFVLNISTLEEIPRKQWKVFTNLMQMVKPGGYLVTTFDYPGLDLQAFERRLGLEIASPDQLLTGKTSILPNPMWEDLSVGALIVRKRE